MTLITLGFQVGISAWTVHVLFPILGIDIADRAR